jgi:hypothetical protein
MMTCEEIIVSILHIAFGGKISRRSKYADITSQYGPIQCGELQWRHPPNLPIFRSLNARKANVMMNSVFGKTVEGQHRNAAPLHALICGS